MKKFPKISPDSTRVYDCDMYTVSEWHTEQSNYTECKHGNGDCETCGTTDKRDVIHETIGGRGKILRLIKQK